ncbi:MAG: potassium channel family protein [Rhodopila sp.]
MIAIGVGILAVVLLAVTLQDAFEVMLLPRTVQRRVRLVGYYYRATWAVWTTIAHRLARERWREHFLGIYGALSLVALFVAWAGGLIMGFGLLFWALQADLRPSVAEQLYMSGVTFFTVGYGDVAPQVWSARLLAVIEAGTGLGFIAVVIGYLPVLYQLFARREVHIILLDTRAGTPPTALGLFWRHLGDDGRGQINALLAAWETWGAELLESHLSYPMLAYYRSQHANQSWLGALTAIMDTCALLMVGRHAASQIQARMTFTMARQVLVQMVRSFRIKPARGADHNRLDNTAFAFLKRELTEVGLTLDEDAEEMLTALRATYEPLLNGLARYLMLSLPGWTADRAARDHWTQGLRGTLVRHLIDELAEGPSARLEAPTRSARAGRWRRLRSRLRSD